MTMNDAILNFAEEKLLSGWRPRPLIRKTLEWMRKYSTGPESNSWFETHDNWLDAHIVNDQHGVPQEKPVVFIGNTLYAWAASYTQDAPWWAVIDKILKFLLNNAEAIIQLLQELGILTDNQYEVINDQSLDFARVNGLS